MKVQAVSIEEFLSAVPEKEADLREIDSFIMETIPDANRDLMKMSSITLLSYWPTGMSIKEWPPIGLAPQKNYISLYVSGEKEEQSLGEYYAKALGKASVGKACIRIKDFSRIDKRNLRRLILDVTTND